MFNNWINRWDIYDLADPKLLERAVGKLFKKSIDRTKEAWSTEGPRKASWGDIPRVRERVNLLATGHVDLDYRNDLADRFLRGKKKLRALSLACGAGDNEIKWFETGVFESIDGIDVSEPRIEAAVCRANDAECGNNVRFWAADIYDALRQDSTYDVILCHMALHHFSPMNEVMENIHRKLSTSGFLIVFEYVGPKRLQWTKRQLEACDGLLKMLPHRYKLTELGWAKKKTFAPSVVRMLVDDASEAIDSVRILPMIEKYLTTLEVKDLGGAILHPLFSRVAQNFLDEQAETERVLDLVLSVEDALMAIGELPQIYISGIFQKN